jgi:TolB-like protein/DNA-binding winged helix-turn-helix (wHTH) protein/Tfp pilus assembly protein PilF
MEALSSTDIFLFERFHLDRRGLFRRDEDAALSPVEIGARALDVLGVLLDRPGDLLSRDEIMVAAWPGTVVEDNNLTVQISTLRRILDQNRQQGSCIQTVPGRGYRFIAPVTRVERAASPASVPSTGNGSDGLMAENEQAQGPGLLRQIGGIAPASRPKGRHQLWGGVMATLIGALVLVAAGVAWNWRSLWPRDALQAPRLSIVVMPFANLGNDPEQQYFADGVTEDLTTALSRISDSFVISRNTAFTYRNKVLDTKQIGRELGVRYVLEGSVRRSSNQIRVSVQLIDAATGAHLWAEQFDSDTVELFALQNEITSRVGNALGLELIGAEAARPTAAPDALDYILRGRAARAKGLAGNTEAIGLFERALALDPRSAGAQGNLANALITRVDAGMTDSATAEIARAEVLIDQVLAASPRNLLAHFARGQALRVQRRCAEASLVYETVLAFDRNSAIALINIGRCRIRTGLLDEAIPPMEQAIRLSPRHPFIGTWYLSIGQVHLLQSRIDEAILWFEKARSAAPGHPFLHAWLASAYALEGDLGRAATELAEARRLISDDRYSSIARLKAVTDLGVPSARALFETTYLAGLRRAGMPEE